MKKLLCKVTMASVLMAILLSNTVLAVSSEVLAKLREFPTTKMELKDFSKEATIYFVGKDGKKKNIGKDFKYGYKVLNDRTSVGIRDLSEALGVDIKWDNENRLVILKTEGKELVYPIDKKVMANNGELVELDT
ncbi:MAG: copper amine oxidase N-terminal domain-containing protein, partial [Tissierellia bacterium]|nr:copper amine oxidase N-terminal domain-containing protein [Tissierellia bacterium]